MFNNILIRLGIRTWRRGLSVAAGFGVCFGGGMLLTEGGCSGALGAECMLDSDCEEGHICIYQFCHAECKHEIDCTKLSGEYTCMVGPKSEREVPNYCAERKACTKTVQCGSGRVCVVEPDLKSDGSAKKDGDVDGGLCEDACTTNNECVDGKVCYMGFCTRAPDPDAGESLPDIVKVGDGQPCRYHSDCISMNCGYRGLCVGCGHDDDCGYGRKCNLQVDGGSCAACNSPSCGTPENSSSSSSSSSGMNGGGSSGAGGSGGAGSSSSGGISSSASSSGGGMISSSSTGSSTSGSGSGTSGGPAMCSGDHILINEIDYDQINDDNKEFVELLNPTCGDLSLEGLALIFINGAAASRGEYGRATLHDTLGAREVFVVATPGDAEKLQITIPNGSVVFSDETLDIENSCEGAMDCADVVALVRLSPFELIDALFYEGPPWSPPELNINGGALLDLAEATSTPLEDDNVSTSLSVCREPNGGLWVKCQPATPGALNN